MPRAPKNEFEIHVFFEEKRLFLTIKIDFFQKN